MKTEGNLFWPESFAMDKAVALNIELCRTQQRAETQQGFFAILRFQLWAQEILLSSQKPLNPYSLMHNLHLVSSVSYIRLQPSMNIEAETFF